MTQTLQQTTSRSYPTATAAVQAQLASAFYGAQALLAAMAISDIIAIWNQMDLRDIRSSWPAIRTALASLINDRFGMSAAQAVTYYAQARQAAGVPGIPPAVSLPGWVLPVISAPPVVPAVSIAPPSPQLVTATLDSTGPYALLGRIKQAQPLTRAMENTSVVMSGAASRLIQNGARQAVLAAVQADPEAVAWMRVTAANPCAWCAMLASRGAVYKSQASAGFKAHGHCRCVAAPCWSRQDAEAMAGNDLYQQWKQVTKGYSGKDALNAWRRYWDSNAGRDGIRVNPAA